MKQKPVVCICAPKFGTNDLSYLREFQLVGECEGFIILIPTTLQDLSHTARGFEADEPNYVYPHLITQHLKNNLVAIHDQKIQMSDVVLIMDFPGKTNEEAHAIAVAQDTRNQVVFSSQLKKGLDQLSSEQFRDWLLSLEDVEKKVE